MLKVEDSLSLNLMLTVSLSNLKYVLRLDKLGW